MFSSTLLPRHQVLLTCSTCTLHCHEVQAVKQIQLLCDFNKDLFKQSHDTALMDEDDRLEELNQITERWWREMGKYVEPQE